MILENKTFVLSNVEKALLMGLDVNAIDPSYDFTLLMYSSYVGSLKLAKHLIKWKANVDLFNKKGETALMIAAQNGK